MASPVWCMRMDTPVDESANLTRGKAGFLSGEGGTP